MKKNSSSRFLLDCLGNMNSWAGYAFARLAVTRWAESRVILVPVSALAILALQWLMSVSSRALFGDFATAEDPLEKYNYPLQIVFGVFIAPFYETLIFQWLLIASARRVRLGWPMAWLLSIVVFAGAHDSIGRWFVGMAIAGGVLAGVYIIERHKSEGRPITTTFLVHALFNAIVFSALAI